MCNQTEDRREWMEQEREARKRKRSMSNQSLTCVVQASLQSKRLPGKVLMEVWQGKTMLQMVLESVLRSESVSSIILQVPNQPAERRLVEWVEAWKSSLTSQDSRQTVLKQVHLISHGVKETPYDFSFMKDHDEDFFRVTADCPLIDPSHFGLLLAWQIHIHSVGPFEGYDILCTHHDRVKGCFFPDGWDIELVNELTLDTAGYDLRKMKRVRAIRKGSLEKPTLPLRASVNYMQDLDFVRALLWWVEPKTDYESIIKGYNEWCKNDLRQTSK